MALWIVLNALWLYFGYLLNAPYTELAAIEAATPPGATSYSLTESHPGPVVCLEFLLFSPLKGSMVSWKIEAAYLATDFYIGMSPNSFAAGNGERNYTAERCEK